ncbi:MULTISPECIES: CvpA family protein [unclassified Gilliamella]|uniref:CvpA family protein n=1 Tax=unclassified Gilliamella TaxID=2685620 RepID=UPI001CE54151|nr:CvpA family protein [Gilliamella sp. B3722]MCX8609306.1 CvpA family protein [Gilliamella sp. B3771]MCX8609525.1 CvpA family protein [Gilliamella sp. B3891]MCX8612386.1 CvpA family protein [Gilliamella sp. B3773]MCX8615806.1 CvpA family protein [Gilliamella sp. B3770]MCX8616835.1 CvpA family protein [Gilliamella sp. B2923]MCX8619230.1 CvpA family protein [Gilliamella sp. B3892]MCX8621680.1 CvpA family protein [Gilliamella sp. B3759]MCX8624111.1 CvpA family protein [Gilliamella sp. B3766]
MNWVDFTIIGVIVFSALISIVRGFVREALSLISWVLAFFIASRFYVYITGYLTFFESDIIRIAVAIAILFVATLIVCGIVSYIIAQLVQKTGLSGTDRVLGICFGVLRGILVVAAVLFFVDTFTPLSQSPYWTQSQLIPHFHFIIRWFFDFIQQSSSFLVQ